jgi:Glycosyltransferase like family
MTSVSIVCVYNDPGVRQGCLDRSIRENAGEGLDVEYIPIDNVHGAYRSAGAALNYGATLAKNDVVVFVHQDAFLHSLEMVVRAAGRMRVDRFGLLGAVGVAADGLVVGQVRDRVVLIGKRAHCPSDVDSVDEVLFMAPRSLILSERLTESSAMAWHGYAVEYGLRVKGLGLRVGVADIPLTHNGGRSGNFDRLGLDIAHGAIANQYPDMLPVRTTCGVLRRKKAARHRGIQFETVRSGYRWLSKSFALRQALDRKLGPIVLADINLDVDRIIERCPGRRLAIVNFSAETRISNFYNSKLELARSHGRVVMSARDHEQPSLTLRTYPRGSWLLVTNVLPQDLCKDSANWPTDGRILGFHVSTGFWALFGPSSAELREHWRSRTMKPFTMAHARTVLEERRRRS